MPLKDKLIEDRKVRWIDIGCGGNFEEGFIYLDTFAPEILEQKFRNNYHRFDILNCQKESLHGLGTFDLVRLQHTLEHFSFEEGEIVLLNCIELLAPGGYLLITVPDLSIHIRRYLANEYDSWEGFKTWASKRIPRNAPASFYFSIFAYSMPYESHRWCYDANGLSFVLERTGKLKEISQIHYGDPLSSQPFTHNRPEEDLCFIAQKR